MAPQRRCGVPVTGSVSAAGIDLVLVHGAAGDRVVQALYVALSRLATGKMQRVRRAALPQRRREPAEPARVIARGG